MKKSLSILLPILLVSCKPNVKTIETYQGKNIVVIDEPRGVHWNEIKEVQVKTKDSIFYIYLIPYDAKDLKVGDTIK